ncbi:hypothetical protein PESHB4_11380 [Pediococcus ethanolidurans]
MYVYVPWLVPSVLNKVTSALVRSTCFVLPSASVTVAVNPLASLALVVPSYVMVGELKVKCPTIVRQEV